MGIIGLVFFWFPIIGLTCGVLGIILGAVGMRVVQQNPTMKTGYGMGVAGLVTGCLAVIVGIIMIIVYSSITW